ncbi:hypothetical protein TNCV_2033861 [Trichonephila clavipes]|nr:hypothetical protein TNCV_2033861 [Trichonephila clavipes]
MKDPLNNTSWRCGDLNPGHFACEANALPLSYTPVEKPTFLEISIPFCKRPSIWKKKDPLNNTSWRCGDLNPGHFACEANALPLSYTPVEKPTFLEISIPFCKRPSIWKNEGSSE